MIMNNSISPHRRAIYLFTFLLMVSMACGQVTTPPPAESQPAPLTIEKEMVLGPGPFIYTDTSAGLANLSSYKASLTLSFDGTQDGETEQWSRTYVMRAAKDPEISELTIETDGNSAEVEPLFLAKAGGMAYERVGEGTCSAEVIVEGETLNEPVEPASLLTGVIGADEAGSETINDVAVDHYTFDQRALAEEGLTDSSGELWVATDGGYIVKYVLSSKAGADYFGEGVEGTLSWSYELSEIDQLATIEIPADCPPGLLDVPVLDGAQDLEESPGMTIFRPSADMAAVAEYYQTTLPDAGWQLDGEPVLDDKAALLQFSREGSQLTVLVSAGDGGSEVRLVSTASGMPNVLPQ
jgi:hypothetical protein